MTSYRFTDKERLALLGAFALDVLDECFTESQLDDDSGPPQTQLYNLAAALKEYAVEKLTEARPIMGYDREALADEQLTELLEFQGDVSTLGRVWAALRPEGAARG